MSVEIQTFCGDDNKATCLICDTTYHTGNARWISEGCACGNIDFFDITPESVRFTISWGLVTVTCSDNWKDEILKQINEQGQPSIFRDIPSTTIKGYMKKKIFYSEDPNATHFEHKGFRGTVEYSKYDGVFHGKVLDIEDLIVYKNDSVDNMEFDFFSLVDDYIEACRIREIRKGLEKYNSRNTEDLKIRPVTSKYLRYVYNERMLKLFEDPASNEGGSKYEELWLLVSVTDEYDKIKELEYAAAEAEETERRKDEMIMPFGKYKDCYVEDIFTDVEHTRWCLRQTFVLYDYPELHHHLKTLYDTIKDSVENTMYFYCLVLSNNGGTKIGKTIQYVPKRLYTQVHQTNNYTLAYENNPVDIKKSFVFKTNDLGVEKEMKKLFKPFLIHGFELIDVDFNTIERELNKRAKENEGFYYYKKPLYDFIPYESLQALRKDFVIYINRYVEFRGEYEAHLRSRDLIRLYDPNFVGGSLN